MKTMVELQASLKQAIQYYRLASRSGSASREADALYTLVVASHEIMRQAYCDVDIDVAALVRSAILETCEAEVNNESVSETLAFILK